MTKGVPFSRDNTPDAYLYGALMSSKFNLSNLPKVLSTKGLNSSNNRLNLSKPEIQIHQNVQFVELLNSSNNRLNLSKPEIHQNAKFIELLNSSYN